MEKREREERFQNLMEEHKKILYKICHSYCQDPADRDDLAQEILFQPSRVSMSGCGSLPGCIASR